MTRNLLKKITLTALFSGIAVVGFAQTGPHIEDNFTDTKTLMGWTLKNGGTGGSMVQNPTTGIITITPGNSGSTGNYRGDFQSSASASAPYSLNSITYPIVAIKFNKPANARVTFDTNLGSFNNWYNNYTEITTTDGRNVYYYDLSASGAKFGASNNIADQPQPMNLSIFQFKIADMPYADGQTPYDIEWVQTFESVAALNLYLTNEGVLPVSLTSFDAKLDHDGSVKLQWNVTAETNNNYYSVERKSGEEDFKQIAKVMSKGTGASIYNLVDKNAPQGPNFYRLSQVDYDGSIQELSVSYVEVSLNSEKSLSIYPQPISGNEFSFTFFTKNKSLGVKLTDLTGKVVFDAKVPASDSNTYHITIGKSLASGLYVLSVENHHQKVLVD